MQSNICSAAINIAGVEPKIQIHNPFPAGPMFCKTPVNLHLVKISKVVCFASLEYYI